MDTPLTDALMSAEENPALANQIASAVFNPAADMPEIDLPPDGSVTLPGGFIDATGALHTEATVRELNGADEEALFKPEVMKNLGRWTQLLIQRGVTRLGPFENPTNNQLGTLLLGDRDMLLLAVRKATYGVDLQMGVNCPACGEPLEITHDLNNVEVRKMDNPLERTFPYKLKSGEEVLVTLAVGSDQEAILSASANKSLPEICTQLLARCVTKDGRPLGLEGARGLGIHDRRELMNELTARQPGPQYSKVDLDCGACGKQFPMIVDLQDLFR